MRKTISLILLALLLMAFATTAFAYTYDFAFEQPYVGCMESTTLKVVTQSPYVDPDGSAAATKYLLSSSRYSYIAATNIITKSNSTRSSFTYKTCFGGAGTSLCLSGYPQATDFVNYTISGTWMP